MTSMTCRILDPQCSSWDKSLGEYASDCMFGAAYHRLCEQVWGGQARLCLVEHNGAAFAWPVILHDVPGAPGYIDLNSAYAFNGPVVQDRGRGTDFLQPAYQTLFAAWRDMGVVSVFTRFSPFWRNDLPLTQILSSSDSGQSALILAGHSVAMDLEHGESGFWRSMRSTLQREIRKASRFGFRLEYDQTWQHLDGFLSVYNSVGDRNDFSARHKLSPKQFRAFRERLGDDARLFHAFHGDRIAASILAISAGSVLHGFFGGPDPDYVRNGAYKLLIHYIASWGASQGYRYLNLGGGRGCSDSDSLFIFKTAFSDLRFPFYTSRLVVHKDKYEELVAANRSRLGQDGVVMDPGFFPAYRAPGKPAAIASSFTAASFADGAIS